MNRRSEDLPAFLDEALDDLSSAEREAIGAWSQHAAPAVAVAEPPPLQIETVKGALLAAVSTEPYRYAPFFARIARLFELPEEQVVSVMTDIPWQKAPLAGIEFVDVETTLSRSGVGAGLVRFLPGVHYPRHRHTEREENLVLAGGYTDDSGKAWRAGDMHVMEPGTAHEYWTDKEHGCVLATISDSRIVWTSPWLRILTALSRVLKR